MKTKPMLIVLTFFVISAWLTASATVRVTNLHLEKSSQFTEFTVECDGACSFTHQIVEAAPNKPYRIVVDVKDAVQALPQHLFTNLPTGAVKQIRTSQYATDPEKVVRVVLDVTGALTYKVKNNENSLTLSINTPSDKDFPKWSAVKSDADETAVAKSKSPKTMPAHPGTEANVPKVTASEPEKKELKLSQKPIDESKLLNKIDKSTSASSTGKPSTIASETPPVAKNEPVQTKTQPAQPQPVTTPKAGQQSVTTTPNPIAANAKAEPSFVEKPTAQSDKSDKNAKPQSTAVGQQAKENPSAAKHADSATIPQNQNKSGTPSGEPADMTKPPKAQKTALPETKVNKGPKLTETTESGGTLSGKLATTTKGKGETNAGTQSAVTQDTLAKESPAGTLQSKSEAVRQKYLAGREKASKDEQPSTVDSAALAATAGEEKPLSQIEQIRLKYRHGIKFVQNDQDELEQQSQTEAEQPQDEEQSPSNVGPGNEFLPEREIVVYATSGRPDPFEPLVEDAASKAQAGELPDVETLRLVGILQDKRTSRALFQDYNGYSYILKTGDRVKNGFVLSIEEMRVLFQIRQYGWNRQVAIDLENEK